MDLHVSMVHTVALLVVISLPGTLTQDDQTVTAIVAVSCVLGFLFAVVIAVIIAVCYRRRRTRSKRKKLQQQFIMQNGATRTHTPKHPPPLPPPRKPLANPKLAPVAFRSVNSSPIRSANRTALKQSGVLVYRPRPMHHHAVDRYIKHKNVRHQTRPNVFTLPPLRLASYKPKVIRTSFSPSDVRESFPDGFRHFSGSASADGQYTNPTHKWTAIYHSPDHLRKENQQMVATQEEHGHIINFPDGGSNSESDLPTGGEVRKYVNVNYLAGRMKSNNEQIVIVDYVVYDDDTKNAAPIRKIEPMISMVQHSQNNTLSHPLREAVSDSVLANESHYHHRQRYPHHGSIVKLPDDDRKFKEHL